MAGGKARFRTSGLCFKAERGWCTLPGRDLIHDMRSGTAPLPETPRRGGATDLILIAVAVMAIGAVGYFGLGALLGGGSPAAGPGPGPAVAKAMITQAAWT